MLIKCVYIKIIKKLFLEELAAIWNDWGPWSECSVSCGTGIQSRYRLCLTATNNSYCIGKAVQSQQCNTESCTGNYSLK